MRAAALIVLFGQAALAQVVVNPARLSPRLREMGSPWDEKPLDCSVTPIKPALNFSFRIQAGYIVRVPMSQYLGSGHGWVILVRVTPRDGDRKPVYLATRTRLPDVPKTKVEIELGGGYLLGEGRYDVRWMMMDDQERVCHQQWTVDAKLTHAERSARVAMLPNTIDAFSLRSASHTASVRDDAPPFRVSILMHAAPISPRRTRLRAVDQMTLVGSLSALMERLPAQAVRMVVFSLEQQKEIYRRDNFTADDIQQVSHALNALELDLVDYQTLLHRKGHIDLLADLVNQEVHAGQPSDAVLILGPVTRFQDKPGNGILQRPAGSVPRFFFFQYKPWMPQRSTLPDTLTLAVNSLKGKVLTIHTPGEFAKAIEQLEKRATEAGK